MEGDGQERETQPASPRKERAFKDVGNARDSSDTILDFTMGSGSTGEACKNLNRSFIGIEKDEEIFKIAYDRLI